MSRLASFRGPSTPSSSPVHHKPSAASPSRLTESTFHRKTRTYLQELRSIAETWDDLVLFDGLKAAKNLTDGRTDLENALALIPDKQPKTRLVGPKVEEMEGQIVELDAVLIKLQKQIRRMSTVIDNMEAILVEAHKVKGWKWVHEEPLWTTWTLEKFVVSVPDLLIPYNRSLAHHTELVDKLRSHSITFENSRDAISQWVAQPWLEDHGWDALWEDLCAAEVESWDKAR